MTHAGLGLPFRECMAYKTPAFGGALRAKLRANYGLETAVLNFLTTLYLRLEPTGTGFRRTSLRLGCLKLCPTSGLGSHPAVRPGA